MNIILLDADEIQDNIVVLNDARAEHLVKVLHCEKGDRVKTGQLNGLIGYGKIEEIKTKYPFQVRLLVQLDRNPPPPPTVDLVLALPRPIMLKRILSQATALGIGHFYIIHSRRVEKSFWKSNFLERNEYEILLRQGLEQAAVDTRMPEVTFHRKFKPFIEDFIPFVKDRYASFIIAHPGGDGRLAELVPKEPGKVLLAIGPEGGWLDYEVEKFVEQGFTCCSMGERILKVDTAVIALLAQISCLRT